MKLMEKYSKHLESLVSERTQELVEEKKKTDRLLYGEKNHDTFPLLMVELGNLVIVPHNISIFGNN